MSSRIQRDGKSAIEKSQELKKAKNLEAPKGMKKTYGIANSFATLSNKVLLGKAQNVGINLGNDANMIDMHISAYKNVEIHRLENFHDNNLDMFLPSDISPSVEELVNSNATNYGMHEDCDSPHNSVEDNDMESWVEVSYKNKSRKKLKFKNVVALIWNPRGLNRPDKISKVHDLIRETCPNIISFSESKKKDFSVI
jgi:hypothetical protein